MALEALLGPPDSERVSFCEFQQTEAESKDRTLRWDDLLIGLSEQAGGSVTFDTWAARGPNLPAGVVFPYGITPGVDTEAELLRVRGVKVNSELEDRIGPGWYMRGALEWNVDTEAPGSPVTGVYVGATTCD